MSVEIIIACLWLLFGGSHIALSFGPVRRVLISKLSDEWFTFTYSVVASITFALLIVYYADHRLESTVLPTLLTGDEINTFCGLLITFGMVLLTSCVFEYASSPMAAFSEAVSAPKGMSRITRHPFLMANVFIFAPHLLLARTTADVILFTGFVTFTILGIIHQDKKLLKRKGADYQKYIEATSTIPFVAIARGKQKLVISELNWPLIALGVLGAISLRYFHEAILAYHGIGFIAVMITVGNIEVLLAWKANRSKRQQT